MNLRPARRRDSRKLGPITVRKERGRNEPEEQRTKKRQRERERERESEWKECTPHTHWLSESATRHRHRHIYCLLFIDGVGGKKTEKSATFQLEFFLQKSILNVLQFLILLICSNSQFPNSKSQSGISSLMKREMVSEHFWSLRCSLWSKKCKSRKKRRHPITKPHLKLLALEGFIDHHSFLQVVSLK